MNCDKLCSCCRSVEFLCFKLTSPLLFRNTFGQKRRRRKYFLFLSPPCFATPPKQGGKNKGTPLIVYYDAVIGTKWIRLLSNIISTRSAAQPKVQRKPHNPSDSDLISNFRVRMARTLSSSSGLKLSGSNRLPPAVSGSPSSLSSNVLGETADPVPNSWIRGNNALIIPYDPISDDAKQGEFRKGNRWI